MLGLVSSGAGSNRWSDNFVAKLRQEPCNHMASSSAFLLPITKEQDDIYSKCAGQENPQATSYWRDKKWFHGVCVISIQGSEKGRSTVPAVSPMAPSSPAAEDRQIQEWSEAFLRQTFSSLQSVLNFRLFLYLVILPVGIPFSLENNLFSNNVIVDYILARNL